MLVICAKKLRLLRQANKRPKTIIFPLFNDGVSFRIVSIFCVGGRFKIILCNTCTFMSKALGCGGLN